MHSMRRNKDNPIDWSAFDEVRVPVRTIKRNRLLNAIAVLTFAAAVAGCILGFGDLFTALSTMNLDDSAETYELMQTKVLSAAISLALSFLTFIPAAFALQFSNSPDRIFVPVVLGVCGIAVTLGAFAAGSTVGSFADARWLVLTAIAVIYLIAYLYVRGKARKEGTRVVSPTGAHSRGNQMGQPQVDGKHSKHSSAPTPTTAPKGKRSRPTKEELWDENEIWKDS